jgi:hypothetical protein
MVVDAPTATASPMTLGYGHWHRPPLLDGLSRTHCMPVGQSWFRIWSQASTQRPVASQATTALPEVGRGQSSRRVQVGRQVPVVPASGTVHTVVPVHAVGAPQDW